MKHSLENLSDLTYDNKGDKTYKGLDTSKEIHHGNRLHFSVHGEVRNHGRGELEVTHSNSARDKISQLPSTILGEGQ